MEEERIRTEPPLPPFPPSGRRLERGRCSKDIEPRPPKPPVQVRVRRSRKLWEEVPGPAGVKGSEKE